MAFHVPEADYRAFGYEPDFDGLPWKESYNAEKEAAVEGAILSPLGTLNLCKPARLRRTTAGVQAI
jgi:hypothetical protein